MGTVGTEMFRAPEILFHPHYLGLEQMGIDGTVFDSVMKVDDQNDRRQFWEKVVLAGGSTMFPGFAQRIKRRTQGIVPDNVTVDVVAIAERKYSAWIGGSILASLPTFKEMWITKKEYEEEGPSIVHRKCP